MRYMTWDLTNGVWYYDFQICKFRIQCWCVGNCYVLISNDFLGYCGMSLIFEKVMYLQVSFCCCFMFSLQCFWLYCLERFWKGCWWRFLGSYFLWRFVWVCLGFVCEVGVVWVLFLCPVLFIREIKYSDKKF